MQNAIQPARPPTVSAEDWRGATEQLRRALDWLCATELIRSDARAQEIIRGMIGEDPAVIDGQMDLLSCRVAELLAIPVGHNTSSATSTRAGRGPLHAAQKGDAPGRRTFLAL
jgi:hypothetical protein